MVEKRIMCRVCGKITKVNAPSQKYCEVCATAMQRVKSRESAKRKAKERKKMWESLSADEKAEVMKKACEYYMHDERELKHRKKFWEMKPVDSQKVGKIQSALNKELNKELAEEENI